jgi:hypothetical protein
MATPNFVKGIGGLATDRYDFEGHVQGTSFRHTADQIDMLVPINIDGYESFTVEEAIDALTGFANGVGQGFATLGDGYDVYHASDSSSSTPPNASHPYDSTIPGLDQALNSILYNTSNPQYHRIRDGGIILIKAGTYIIQNTVLIPPGIMLVGENYGTKICNATGGQSMFRIVADLNRSMSGQVTPPSPFPPSPQYVGGADGGVNSSLFMFSRETKFFNLTLSDNFVEPKFVGDTSYKNVTNNGSQISPAPGLIIQEGGSHFTCDNVKFLGKSVFGQTSYVLGTVNPVSTGTILNIINCFIDGFCIGGNYNTSGGVNDFFVFNNNRVRVFGGLTGDVVSVANNCFFSAAYCNVSFSNNFLYSPGNAVTGLYVYNAPSPPPSTNDTVRASVVGNTGATNYSSSTEPNAMAIYLSNETIPGTSVLATVSGNAFGAHFGAAYNQLAISSNLIISSFSNYNSILVHSDAAPINITLPTAASVAKGRFYIVYDQDGYSATNNITISTSGADTINGSGSHVISSSYLSSMFMSDGVSTWSLYNWGTGGGGGGSVTWANDLVNSTNTNQYVSSLSYNNSGYTGGTGGNIAINGTHTNLVFNVNNIGPTISQADVTNLGGAGVDLTIQAQNASGSASTGGNLILHAGSGSSSGGSVSMQAGDINGSKIIIAPSSPSVGGSVTITSGNGSSSAGIIEIVSGSGTTQGAISIGNSNGYMQLGSTGSVIVGSLAGFGDGYVAVNNSGVLSFSVGTGGGGGGGGITALTGDVDAAGTGSVVATVIRINGTTVPPTPSANQVLVATSGTSAVWEQITNNQISPSAAIAVNKLIAGSPGQILISNSTPTWETVTGDVSITSSAATTVVALRNNPVEAQSLGASQDGYVLTWNSVIGWSAEIPPSGTVTWGNDLVNSTSSAQYVSSISYSSSSAGGAVAINGTGTSFNFAANNTGPLITQTVASGTAVSFSIIAQSAGTANDNAGSLILNGGSTTNTGTGIAGFVNITAGTSHSGMGGNVVITGGGTTSGTPGIVIMTSGDGNTSMGVTVNEIFLSSPGIVFIEAQEIVFDTSEASPTITQHISQSGNGYTFTLQAQQGATVGSGTNNNGGVLSLTSGLAGTGGTSGTGSPGGIQLFLGNSNLGLTITAPTPSSNDATTIAFIGTAPNSVSTITQAGGTGTGSNMRIIAQAAGGSNNNGGSVILIGGANTGSGVLGAVTLNTSDFNQYVEVVATGILIGAGGVTSFHMSPTTNNINVFGGSDSGISSLKGGFVFGNAIDNPAELGAAPAAGVMLWAFDGQLQALSQAVTGVAGESGVREDITADHSGTLTSQKATFEKHTAFLETTTSSVHTTIYQVPVGNVSYTFTVVATIYSSDLSTPSNGGGACIAAAFYSSGGTATQIGTTQIVWNTFPVSPSNFAPIFSASGGNVNVQVIAQSSNPTYWTARVDVNY